MRFCLGRAKKRTTCNLPYLSVEQVELKLAQHWAKYGLPTEMVDTIRDTVTTELKEAAMTASRVAREQKQRLKKLDGRKQKLIDAHLCEAIPMDDLKVRQAAIAVEIHEAERPIELYSGQRDVAFERLDSALSLLTHAEHPSSSGSSTRRSLGRSRSMPTARSLPSCNLRSRSCSKSSIRLPEG